MGNIKRSHPAGFKAKVALDLIKEVDTLAAIASKYAIHPTQARQWKMQMLNNIEALFSDKPSTALKEKDELIDQLYKQIGQLKVELDWLKKKLSV
jgi:transposase-like protein